MEGTHCGIQLQVENLVFDYKSKMERLNAKTTGSGTPGDLNGVNRTASESSKGFNWPVGARKSGKSEAGGEIQASQSSSWLWILPPNAQQVNTETLPSNPRHARIESLMTLLIVSDLESNKFSSAISPIHWFSLC